APQRLTDLLVAEVAAEERVVKVDDGQVADFPGEVDRVEDRPRVAVAVRGVAVDVGCEVPDPGPETLVAHDVLILSAGIARVRGRGRRTQPGAGAGVVPAPLPGTPVRLTERGPEDGPLAVPGCRPRIPQPHCGPRQPCDTERGEVSTARADDRA